MSARRKGGGGGGLSLALKLAVICGGAALAGSLLMVVLATQKADVKVIFLVGLVVAGAVGGVAWHLGGKLAGALSRLAADVAKLARGDFNARFRRAGFKEAGKLVRQLEDLSANLREGVIEEKLAEIREREARLLGRMREKLMPDSFTPPSDWELDGIFLPGKRGGGDFLDVIPCGKSHFLVVGTAAGAGTAAGMIMVLGRTLLREWLVAGGEPGKVLRRLNTLLSKKTVSGASLSLTLLELDPAGENELTAWGCGLGAPLYFYGRGELELITLEGIALGLDSGPVFDEALQSRRVVLERGQRFTLVTPGLCGNLSPTGEEFGEKRLEEALIQHGPKNTGVFVDMVAGEVEGFLEDEEPDEDVALLSLKTMG